MKTGTTRSKKKSTTRSRQNRRTKEKEQLITCDEVERLYGGRWVMMDVRKLSRWNQPEAGIVVFSAASQEELFAFGKKLLKENPKRHYYFFYAGDPSLKGPAVITGSTTDVPLAR
jgi:hypothetical protein